MIEDFVLYKDSSLTSEENTELGNNIDKLVKSFKSDRQELNRLVFDSVSAMTSAEELETELANKKGLKRFVGGITGSNKALQDKINANRAAAQYASQIMLKKLAEQNLMTLDIVTVLNNKLNALIITNNEQINHIYKWLLDFFKQNRSDIFRMETRIDNLERNVQLLNWENSICHQQFDGVNYAELDDASKIVCLARDFYDITHGQWSTNDLLLLQAAMDKVALSPKDKVNYFEVIKSIAYDAKLREKFLNAPSIPEVSNPSYLISSAALKKMNSLQKEEYYIVAAVKELTADKHLSDKDVIESLAVKYLAQEVSVNVDVLVENYDLIIDLLFNLQNLLPVSVQKQAEQENYTEDENKNDKAEPVEKFQDILKLAQDGDPEAQYLVGEYYLKGDVVEKDDVRASGWLEASAKQEYPAGMSAFAACCEQGIGRSKSSNLAKVWYNKAFYAWKKMAIKGNHEAEFYIGTFYEEGKGGIQVDVASAKLWYDKAALGGIKEAKVHLCRLGK